MITEEIETRQTTYVQKMFKEIRSLPITGFFINAVFWLWNSLFILLAGIFIIPYLIVPLIIGTIEGSIPVDILLFAISTIAIVAGSIIAVIHFLRKWPYDTAKIAIWNVFYGVEGPLLTLIVYRLFFTRELNGSVAVLLAGLFLSIILLNLQLFFSHVKMPKKVNLFILGAWIIPILISLYFGTLLSFYIVPSAIFLIKGFFGFTWVPIFFSEGFIIILVATIFFFFSATLLVFLPIVSSWLFIKQGINSLKRSCTVFGARTTALTASMAGILFITSALILDQNQSGDVIVQLQKPVTTDEQRKNLLSQEDRIRTSLLNAYLASYRYLSTIENDHIFSMYREHFPKPFCQTLQKWYNTIAFPFLYRGPSFTSSQNDAKTLYEQFFDIPIQRAEKKSINKALNATWNRDEAKAGLLNTNEKFVYLAEQSVSVVKNGTLATVTIFEEYHNQTFSNQEVFYYFTLPENAAVSGLWLSDDKSIPKKYSFSVSPRGAAQEVYTSQVHVQRDPALLEKVGPIQYRLRAFPVPAKQSLNNGRSFGSRTTTDNPTLQLWFEYKAMPNPDGTIPMPALIEKRNVYWDRKTKRNSGNSFKYKHVNDWIPDCLPGNFPVLKDEFTVPVDSNSFLIIKKVPDTNSYHLPGHTAVVIDRSKSMERIKSDLSDVITSLHNRCDDITIFWGGYEWRPVDFQKFNIDNIQFFGSTSLTDLVEQTFNQIGHTDTYSQIVVCTDDGGYEMSKDKRKYDTFKIPLSILHIGGKIPAAYPDELLETISSCKGFSANSLDDLMRQYHSRYIQEQNDNYIGMLGNYTVSYSGKDKLSGDNPIISGYPELKPVFAQMVINDFSSRHDMKQPENLDYIHKLAKSNSLVTRYSSMIVLVNELQKELLAEAEARDDRFDREIETGHESISSPTNAMQVSTVPEPHEWALIICCILTVIIVFRYRRQIL
jgi:putative PEP-CTERM system integral membrane protein